MFLGLPYWVNKYLQFLYPLVGLFSLWLYSIFLCLLLQSFFLKYFVQYKYCYPSFLFTSIFMINVFHPFSFNLELGLKWIFCRQHIDWSCFFIHSVTLCLLVGLFSPFTFKVIIDRYVFIANLLLVLWLFL